MMNLEQYKETMHKCSKCGLCQESCPAYRANGNECETARGFLIMLKGILQKEVPMKKGINKYLDLCLRCGKCSSCCPSEIPIDDVIFAAKRKYLYSTFGGLLTRISQSAFANKYFKKKNYLKSQSFEAKVVYLGANAAIVTEKLNQLSVEVLNNRELSWGVEYLLSGNIIRFRRNFNEVLAYLIKVNPQMVVVDIPVERFKSLVKEYINKDFNIPVKYLGEFETCLEDVSKYYNEEYATRLLDNLRLS